MKRFALILALCPLPLAAETDQEDADKGFIVELLQDNLSGDERTVSISGFEGALSSEARIAELTVADSEGTWLTLKNVVLDWNRSALLRGAIDVETLSAAEIIVARTPIADSSLPAAEATPFSLPDLPVSITLDKLAIERLELAEVFIGEPLTLEIEGAASLGGGEGTFNLTANRLNDTVGRFELAGSYANETRNLAIDMALDEGPSGIIARLIGLPGDPSVGFSLQGDAPLDDFTADLAIATNGIDRITGNFTTAAIETGQDFSLDINGDVTTLFAPEYREFFGPSVALTASGLAPQVGGFDLDTLAIEAEAITLEGSAKISSDGFPSNFDLQGTLSNDDIVLLPLSGPKTFVTSANLDVQFDAEISDQWTADITAIGFDRPGLFIQTLGLSGGGTIRASFNEVTALLNYSAEGLELDSEDAETALGDTIAGRFRLQASDGNPTTIQEFSLNGAGISLDAEATISPADPG